MTLNLSGSVALGGIAGQAGSAGLAIPTGLIRLSSSFNGRGAPYTNYSMSFIDNLSVLRGNHSMKFGVEVRAVTLYNDQLGGTTYSFANVTAFLANQPDFHRLQRRPQRARARSPGFPAWRTCGRTTTSSMRRTN